MNGQQFVPMGGVARGHHISFHLPGGAVAQSGSAESNGRMAVFVFDLLQEWADVVGFVR